MEKIVYLSFLSLIWNLYFTSSDSAMTQLRREGDRMTSEQKVNGTGFMRLKRAITCSYAGISAAWKNEEAFRQELLLGAVLIPLACWLGDSGLERALLVGSLLLVMIVELLNTAVEVVVNRISLDRHELSGLAKDLGSAAVSMSLVNAGLTWLLVLFT